MPATNVMLPLAAACIWRFAAPKSIAPVTEIAEAVDFNPAVAPVPDETSLKPATESRPPDCTESAAAPATDVVITALPGVVVLPCRVTLPEPTQGPVIVTAPV